MNKTIATADHCSADILGAASLHLEVLDAFIAVARDKMAGTSNPFARDSLNDLLGSLAEQRETYLAFAAPLADLAA